MINFDNMDYYLVKGRVVLDGIPSMEGHFLIETDFNVINLYSVNIGYTKIKNVESIMIDSIIYNMDDLKHYCRHIIKLESLYLNLPK